MGESQRTDRRDGRDDGRHRGAERRDTCDHEAQGLQKAEQSALIRGFLGCLVPGQIDNSESLIGIVQLGCSRPELLRQLVEALLMSARAASEAPTATFEATAPLPAAIAPALTVPPEIVIPELFPLMCQALS